jgi:hypothetical protein
MSEGSQAAAVNVTQADPAVEITNGLADLLNVEQKVSPTVAAVLKPVIVEVVRKLLATTDGGKAASLVRDAIRARALLQTLLAN